MKDLNRSSIGFLGTLQAVLIGIQLSGLATMEWYVLFLPALLELTLIALLGILYLIARSLEASRR